LVKPGGLILILQRGQSYVSLYNTWLQFIAARDLLENGSVNHLDIEKIVDDHYGGLKVVHKERKNLGMTYIYIIKNEKEEEEKETEDTAKPEDASRE